MNDQKQLNELKQASPYIFAYSIFWACANLFLYWSKFNINPFQYVSPGEILTLSVKLFAMSSGVALTIATTKLFTSSSTASDEQMDKEANGLKSYAMLILIFLLVASYFARNIPALYYAMLSTTMLLITPLSCTLLFRTSFSSLPARTAVAAFIVTLPLFSGVSAQIDGNKILNKEEKNNMIRVATGTCQSGCLLIGKLGDYFSVLGRNGKVIMIKSEEMKVFEIYEFDFSNQ